MTTLYTTAPMTIDELFNAIFDDAELNQYLKERADKKLKEVIKLAKRRRKTMTTDSKRSLLDQLGFEKTQDEMWRKKKKTA